MNEKEKRGQIRSYFYGNGSWAGFIVLIGLVTIFEKPAVGIILLGFGGWLVHRALKCEPKDEQIDAWFQEDLKTLAERALQKSGMPRENIIGDALFILGLPQQTDMAVTGFKHKKGRDGAIRLSPVSVLCFHLANDQLLSYSCAFDFITGNPVNESTGEFFFKDVVSVATRTQSVTVEIPKIGTIQANAAEVFELTTTGGNKISATLEAPEIIAKLKGKNFALSRSDAAVQAIRETLRKKKAA